LSFFEERIAHFDGEIPVQQWYGDTSVSGLSFVYGGMGSASSSHPSPFESTPLVHTHEEEEEEEEEEEGEEVDDE
jgi:hypothetical protein